MCMFLPKHIIYSALCLVGKIHHSWESVRAHACVRACELACVRACMCDIRANHVCVAVNFKMRYTTQKDHGFIYMLYVIRVRYFIITLCYCTHSEIQQ